MEKQKLGQKKWYNHKTPLKGDEIIEIGTLTHIQRLKDLFPTQKTGLSLNCGCGNGGQNDTFGPSIGMDISIENIRRLKKAGGQGIVADMEFLPFRDDTFDIVYGFGILHHLSNIKRGVAEASRVLKKGGYIGFGGENNGLCLLNYIMPLIYRNWTIEKGFYRIRKGNLRKIFREAGIEEFKLSRYGMTAYGMGRTVYKLTSIAEFFLSRLRLFNSISGYCYLAGKKVISFP
jgi:ubiquinone/menaquinone biosynthesis C-methylase UbiE